MMGSRIDTLPCFTKTISRIAITKDYPSSLPFPKEFSDLHRGRIESEVLLKINTNKKWVVKIGPVKNNAYAFRGTGWTSFVSDNDLAIGDEVMFTMLSKRLFSVKITRVSDAPVKVKQEPEELESVSAGPVLSTEKSGMETEEAGGGRSVKRRALHEQTANQVADRNGGDDRPHKVPRLESDEEVPFKVPREDGDKALGLESEAVPSEVPPPESEEATPTPMVPGDEVARDEVPRAAEVPQAEVPPPEVPQAEVQPEVPQAKAREVPQAEVQPEVPQAKAPEVPQAEVQPEVPQAKVPEVPQAEVQPEVPQAKVPQVPNTEVKAPRVEQEETTASPFRPDSNRVHNGEAIATPAVLQAEVPRVNVEDIATPAPPAQKPTLGSAQEPFEIDMSGVGAADAGIHMILKTDTKKFKLFISVAAIEAAAEEFQQDATMEPVPEHITATIPHTVTPADTTQETVTPANTTATTNTIATPSTVTPSDATNTPTPAKEPEYPEPIAIVDTTAPPRVTVSIKPTNLAPYCRLPIEKAFAVKWLPDATCSIKLINEAGEEWTVKWIVSQKRVLSQGWGTITKRYNLCVGDLCTFDVLDPTTLRFFVTDSAGRKKVFGSGSE